MDIRTIVVGAMLTFASLQANAGGWAIGSQHSALKNYVIVDVGEVSEVEPPFNTQWKDSVYQMNGRCFIFSGYMGYWSYGSKAALLLVSAQKDVKLALIEAVIGSVKVELQSVGMIECPSGTSVVPYSDDPDEQLRLLKKKLEELKKKR